MSKLPNERIASVLFWTTCAILPFLILCCLAIWGNIYPFGSESFLTEDLKYQYIDFFAWFRGVLLGENSVYYSPAQGLGFNTWGLYSYYTASPFNLLLLFFNQDNLTLAVFIISALKLSCISLAMSFYLRRRFELSYTWTLLLALSFTFSSWTVTQLRNPMWLDALILLPIGANCCWQIIREGKLIGLSLVVAANVICCWYMAYISILFFCFFVLFELSVYIFSGNHVNAHFIILRALRFSFAIIMGLALSSWTFIPTVLAMLGNTGADNILDTFLVSWQAIGDSFLPCKWQRDIVPQFYVGLAAEGAALLFLFNRKISLRLRFLGLLFLLFMMSSATIAQIQFIWCGFRIPNGFFSRTAFLTSFTIIWLAACCIKTGFKRKLVDSNERPRPVRTSSKLVLKPLAMIVLISLTVIELIVNGHLSWNQLYFGYSQESHDSYVSEALAQLSELQTYDNSKFYRFDKTYTRAGEAALNEGIAVGFNQLSSYSSSSNPQAITFLNLLGYSSAGEFSTRYSSPIITTDSLLGIKYVSSTEQPAGYLASGLSELSNNATIYQNPTALSLGFLSDYSSTSISLSDYDDPFERQNAIFEFLSNNPTPIFRKLDPKPVENTPFSWKVEIPENCIGYAYIVRDPSVGNSYQLSLNIDKHSYKEGWRFDNTLRSLNQPADTTVNVSVSISSWSEQIEGSGQPVPEGTECLFYALDLRVFYEVMNELSLNQLNLISFSDNHISGTITVPNEGNLVLSIPYDEGWTVKVDGVETAPNSLFDGGMMSVSLSPGTRYIELNYRSPGILAGGAISVASWLILLLYLLRKQFIARKTCQSLNRIHS